MRVYPHLSLRLSLTSETLFGPGKAALLQGVSETGSIAAAGRAMGMSYKRAWYLIDTLNTSFVEPLIVSTKGGKAGGGAKLTPTGAEVLALYRHMERAALDATAQDLERITALATSPQAND